VANNKTSADRRVFSYAPAQKKRRNAQASDRQAEAAEETALSEGQVCSSYSNSAIQAACPRHFLQDDSMLRFSNGLPAGGMKLTGQRCSLLILPRPPWTVVVCTSLYRRVFKFYQLFAYYSHSSRLYLASVLPLRLAIALATTPCSSAFSLGICKVHCAEFDAQHAALPSLSAFSIYLQPRSKCALSHQSLTDFEYPHHHRILNRYPTSGRDPITANAIQYAAVFCG
jgi:hypothetical protein